MCQRPKCTHTQVYLFVYSDQLTIDSAAFVFRLSIQTMLDYTQLHMPMQLAGPTRLRRPRKIPAMFFGIIRIKKNFAETQQQKRYE
jgi:hypothetical protein